MTAQIVDLHDRRPPAVVTFRIEIHANGHRDVRAAGFDPEHPGARTAVAEVLLEIAATLDDPTVVLPGIER